MDLDPHELVRGIVVAQLGINTKRTWIYKLQMHLLLLHWTQEWVLNFDFPLFGRDRVGKMLLFAFLKSFRERLSHVIIVFFFLHATFVFL